MFRIPESIAELGKKRIEGFPVEGFIYGEGPKKPELMLIGEAPGEFELIDGIPFIGRAGKELMKSLQTIGLTREDVYITSAVEVDRIAGERKKIGMGRRPKGNIIGLPRKKRLLRMHLYLTMNW